MTISFQIRRSGRFSSFKQDTPIEDTCKWTIRLLWLAVCLYIYASSYGHIQLGGKVYTIATITFVGAIILFFIQRKVRIVYSPIIIPAVFVALLNILFAQNLIIASSRWLLWIVMLVLIMSWTWILPVLLEKRLIAHLVWIMAGFIAGKLIEAHYYAIDFRDIRSALHMAGFYANIEIAIALYAERALLRYGGLSVGIMGVFLSGSGGAAFGLLFTLVTYIFFRLKSKNISTISKVLVTVITLALVLSTTNFFHRVSDRFVRLKVGDRSIHAGYARLDRSGKERLELMQMALSHAWKNPMGIGFGSRIDISSNRFNLGHFHNGPLDTLVEIGFMGFFFIYVTVLLVGYKLLFNPRLPHESKGFFFTFLITFIARSMSEDYKFIDLGSFVPFLTIFLFSYFYWYSQKTGPGALPIKKDSRSKHRHYPSWRFGGNRGAEKITSKRKQTVNNQTRLIRYQQEWKRQPHCRKDPKTS
jgi:O-antigen ligase